MHNVAGDTASLPALEQFMQCANRCQGVDLLLRQLVDVVVEHRLADRVLIVLLNGDDLNSRLWISKGIKQEALGELLDRMFVGFPDSVCGGELFDGIPGVSNAVFIDKKGGKGWRIGLFASRQDAPEVDSSHIERMLELLASMFSLAVSRVHQGNFEYSGLQKVIDAKYQWEVTVDNLPELICLLDAEGAVVRTNKTLENWGLGRVSQIKGSSVHSMLHPECADSQCTLAHNWVEAWRASIKGQTEVKEFFDSHGQRDLRLSLTLSNSETPLGSEEEGFSVLVVEDISGSKWEERLVEDYSEEQYRQLQNQLSQINQIHSDLADEKANHHQLKKILLESESIRESLSARLLTAEEVERKRIAAELHDGIGQTLSAIKFGMEQMLITSDGSEPQLDVDKMRATVARLQQAVEEIRRISMGLRPSMLDDLGLVATLGWLCRQFRNLYENINIEVDIDIDESVLSEVQVNMIFRITQEALNNISKHARADTVWIHLTSSGEKLQLEIRDNGVGFDQQAILLRDGFGLSSMRERAELSGGVISIESSLGEGALIRIVWPNVSAHVSDLM